MFVDRFIRFWLSYRSKGKDIVCSKDVGSSPTATIKIKKGGYIMQFILTNDQAESICKYYDEDASQMEEYEIFELLDRLIDETCN